MRIFIIFWKLETENSLLHVFNFLHKLSFKNSFCFLSILGCQTSFSVSKIENYFWKQKIIGKIVTKHILRDFSFSSVCFVGMIEKWKDEKFFCFVEEKSGMLENEVYINLLLHLITYV